MADAVVSETRDRSLAAEGYRLEVGEAGIRLSAADDAGARHGRATLDQLRRAAAGAGGEEGRLPGCRIEDWPDFSVRG